MASSNTIESLIGTWDHVRSENLDDFLKEVGVPMLIRMMATRSNPRVVISEKDGVWTIRTETILKTQTTTFTPGVEFTDTTPGGQQVQTLIVFENGTWIQRITDPKVKETVVKRFVNDQGLQQVNITTINDTEESKREVQSELAELHRNVRDLFTSIHVINMLSSQTKKIHSFDVLYKRSRTLSGKECNLTRDEFEKWNHYFHLTVDQQLINFMNKDRLLGDSFASFIQNLPTESVENSTFYKDYPSLLNIPADCVSNSC
ncbi:unnamed protein product [Rotaria sp. Silwood2]|nr:unnamed protein product [Rotaria sp. Silwood2]CAF4383344.1 unnamed protein product [Rotaria sp. Silwood2]